MNDKIIAARITAMPRPMPVGMFDPMPEVIVTTEDSKEHTLFSFYPDELHFTPQEFIGLTIEEAHQLRTTKDIQYLKS